MKHLKRLIFSLKRAQEIVTLASDLAREGADKDDEKESHLSAGDSVGYTGTDLDNCSMFGSRTTLVSKSSLASSVEIECTRL